MEEEKHGAAGFQWKVADFPLLLDTTSGLAEYVTLEEQRPWI